jgi:hypothetical protein
MMAGPQFYSNTPEQSLAQAQRMMNAFINSMEK